MAVSALAGCVTVQRPPLPGPVVAPSQPPVPRPEGQAETQVVQAPAREALEMVGPSRRPTPTTPTRQPRTAKAAAPAEQQPPPRPRSHPHPRPARPEPRRPTQPRVRIPDVEEEVRRNTDVCALGRKYGGWQGDSPEAVICEQAYGR
ncbi:hypothetical protein OG562_05580 [Streptomyces sp. NBC_01275]|uniref:hypothetical protein n=1 Tax=Streptomyces sp. NBC_01275 TaxID=2903807 RepID=UPI002256A4BA|nr:hypothetical protein [Streptomyces sp. NBC_01275]MCX4760449.1 hypothetical protein [Streptomyces sp. NBC_01275]